MPATFSPQARFGSGLRILQCGYRNFCETGRSLGLRISSGPLSEWMTEKRLLDHETEQRLLAILQRMEELQHSVDIPVAWDRTDMVVNALTTRLLATIANELGLTERDELSKMADRASDAVATK